MKISQILVNTGFEALDLHEVEPAPCRDGEGEVQVSRQNIGLKHHGINGNHLLSGSELSLWHLSAAFSGLFDPICMDL